MTLYTVSSGGIIQAQDVDQTVNWLQHFVYNVFDYGAKGDGKTVTDGAITTGTPTLTSASAAFTSTDVGKYILVHGAGVAGADLATTISAYVNATTVTLAASASTTVSGAIVSYVTDDTAAIQAAISALPACSVRDVGGNLVAGQTGVIFFPPGIYKISALLTLPPGDITLQGSGLSSWVPGVSLTPFQNLGGSVLVTTDYTDGLLTCPKDASNFPATALFLRDIEFRTVSPSVAQTSSAPPIVSLSGMISGEIANVNVLEVQTGGGIGANLFKIFSLESGSATDYKYLYNIHGYGGTEGIVLNATHLAAINMSGGNIGTNVGGVTACCIMILQNDDNYFANIHCFSGANGIASNFGNDSNHPILIHSSQFESVTHYLTTCFSPSQGTMILENPTWNSSVDPTTDIPAQIPSTITVLSNNEVDRTGLFTPTHVLHVAPAASSVTAGTSPFTFPVQQYACVYVLTTVGGMTALSLDGQALFNGTFTIGQQVYVGAGHTLIATWATTAPVFKLLPQ